MYNFITPQVLGLIPTFAPDPISSCSDYLIFLPNPPTFAPDPNY